MILIHYNSAFKALERFVSVYNEDKISLSEKLRQAPVATAKEIIKIYGSALLKANAVSKIDISNLPSLKTNNVQLAKLTGASARTIQRHINRLQEVGIITRKEWHGTNSSYELWINPNIVLTEEQIAENRQEPILTKSAKTSEKSTFEKGQTSNCPHTESRNTINNIVIGVDKWITADTAKVSNDQRCSLPLTGSRSSDHSGYIFSGSTDESKLDGSLKENYKHEQGRLRADRAEKGTYPHCSADKTDERGSEHDKGQVTASESGRSRSLRFYRDALWTLAKNVLYKDVYLTDFQINQGKQLLHDWYEPVPTAHLSRVHQIYVERITLTRKFIEKDPQNRFVQLPFKFFDTKNPSGFTGTKKWWDAQQKRNQEVQENLILQAQIRRFMNNEKKDLDKKKPSLTVFRECETRVGKLNNPLLLEQFHSAVMNHQFVNQIY